VLLLGSERVLPEPRSGATTQDLEDEGEEEPCQSAGSGQAMGTMHRYTVHSHVCAACAPCCQLLACLHMDQACQLWQCLPMDQACQLAVSPHGSSLPAGSVSTWIKPASWQCLHMDQVCPAHAARSVHKEGETTQSYTGAVRSVCLQIAQANH